MEWTNYGELMRWAKLKSVDIHAGALKTAGDPSRDPDAEGGGLLPGAMVDNMYAQFVQRCGGGAAYDESKTRSSRWRRGRCGRGQQAHGAWG